MDNLSSDQNYIDYIQFIVIGNLEQAKISLKNSIEVMQNKENINIDTLSYLYQKLGSLIYLKGDEKQAIELYDLSIKVANESLISKLLYAKFLINECKKYQLAINMCNSIIESATNTPYPESETDFSSEHYLNQAKELINECESII